MIDPGLLRRDFEAAKAAINHKKFSVPWEAIAEVDLQRREAIGACEAARAEQKQLSKTFGKGATEPEKRVELKTLATRVKSLEAKRNELQKDWEALLAQVPNMPDPSAPIGKSEADNVVVATHDAFKVSEHAKPHWDIEGFAAGIDFARGVKVTGAGFPFYIASLAKWVRSLTEFFLNAAIAAGYTELLPPLMVNAASAKATGQLPDKEGQMYGPIDEDYYMVPTAEVPLTNFFKDEILKHEDLPVLRCAYTPCFRREAGSWGRQVRGLNRLHQFDKVELVQWVHPDHGLEQLEQLRAHAESLLSKLELPYRVLEICTGDMGLPHARQYDLEVFAAGQERWLEVSSCSLFTDFQARGANIRYREKDKSPQFVHTLNGSALAVPRVLAALLENGLNADNSVAVPACLQAAMGCSKINLGS